MAGLRIQAETLDQLTSHIKAAEPEETGTFALVGAVKRGRDTPDLVVHSLLLPAPSEWAAKGEDWLTPSTSYINRATVAADRGGLGLAFIHSHPSPNHPAGLSWVDEDSTRRLMGNLLQILGDVPMASLVFTPNSFAGVVKYPGQELVRCDRLRIIGPRLITLVAADARGIEGTTPDMTPERQVLALGAAGQEQLARMKVGIVGAGGTGSGVAEQLSRMGVTDFVLIDDDRVEPSNISRVYGSTPSDGRRRRFKVAVLAREIRRISPACKVRCLRRSITDPGVSDTLLDTDVVFCCTDTDGSRAILNDLAQTCFVPVIDVGCKIDVAAGSVRGVYGRVRYLRPGLPCLWCTETIDGTRILRESMSPEERERLAASGYGTGVGPQPSVIHLTTIVASLAISEFLSIALGVPNVHDGSWLSISLSDPFLRRVKSTPVQNCRCQTIRGMGAPAPAG
jgi:molybdopterin-synthase adenylyltransferase